MSLQYKFFVISIRNIPEAESDLNRFLRSVRVVAVHRDFVAQGENSFWCMAVEYMSAEGRNLKNENASRSRPKVDYKELLEPEDFALFVKLREWRKDAAGKDAIPVYTIFTNEQLAKIAEKRVTTKAGLHEIEGIGDARVKKYGEAVIEIVTKETGVEGK